MKFLKKFLKKRPRSKSPVLALCFPCKVIKVHDGDTSKEVEVTIKVKVRYDNCWAPEIKEPFGPESRTSAKLAEGKDGRLFIDLEDMHNLADLFTFGRIVGEIWVDGSHESESQRQVRLKLASTKKNGKLGE